MKKYNEIKRVGLYNYGNTCFINSCIQVINQMYELHNILDTREAKKDTPEHDMTREWNNLRDTMWSGNGTVKPHRFVKYVQNIANRLKNLNFSGWEQNDVSEFLHFFINCLHETFARKVSINIQNEKQEYKVCYDYIRELYKKEYSEIHALFYGITVTQILPKKSKTPLSETAEASFMLTVPVFSANGPITNLEKCIESYYEPCVMEGENAWFNDKTSKHEDIIKATKIWKLPPIVVITFNRFNTSNHKVQHRIDFPLENLDFSKYMLNAGNAIYDCFGVCNHYGNTYGGHYTSYVKHKNDEWRHYNDTIITNVDATAICSEHAYCLFYRKK